jgi:predicted methyltransferase MtxX (methanogen marker protein 4)
MTNRTETLWSKIQKLSTERRASIGFGLRDLDPGIIDSLVQCRDFADIVVVTASPQPIDGFRVVRSDDPEGCLASLLVRNEVEGIVRGTIDDKRTLNAYMNLTHERDTYCPTLIEDALGRQYFIAPVSNSDGWTAEQRSLEALAIARFMQGWGVSPSIAVYTAIRHETYETLLASPDPVDKQLCATYDDAGTIVANLRAESFTAENMTIEFNTAVAKGFNLHICLNGIVGNQVGRAVMSSGGKMLTCARIGFSHVYEDNSRTQTDFRSHIQWASALVNSRHIRRH